MASSIGLKEVAIVGLIAILVVQFGGYYDFTTLIPGATTGGGGTNLGSNYVDTEATITWVLMDQYAGSGLSSKSVAVYKGTTLMETCTTASTGVIATSLEYETGESLNIWVDDGNAHYWIPVVVPQMLKTVAEGSSPTFRIELKGYTVNTVTDTLYIGSTACTDGMSFNMTSNQSSTMKYSWDCVTDNRAILATGFNDARTGALDDGVGVYTIDPRYNTRLDIVCFIVCNTTVLDFTNVDGSYIAGSYEVFYKVLDAADFIKYKVGSTYLSDGSGVISFPMDGSAGTAANYSIQFYIFGGADVNYAIAHQATGSTATNYGPDAFTLAEQTAIADTTAA